MKGEMKEIFILKNSGRFIIKSILVNDHILNLNINIIENDEGEEGDER